MLKVRQDYFNVDADNTRSWVELWIPLDNTMLRYLKWLIQ